MEKERPGFFLSWVLGPAEDRREAGQSLHRACQSNKLYSVWRAGSGAAT